MGDSKAKKEKEKEKESGKALKRSQRFSMKIEKTVVP
jgi:hypothetical protein